jgi:Carboxypeptidase regulatory-like domain/TonB-dependent Receptor Plug Domain
MRLFTALRSKWSNHIIDAQRNWSHRLQFGLEFFVPPFAQLYDGIVILWTQISPIIERPSPPMRSAKLVFSAHNLGSNHNLADAFERLARVFLICIVYVCTASLILSFPTSALAQSAVTGGVTGIVTDSSGAVIPKARVTIVNTSTGDTRVLETNDDGRYVVPFLKPGAFTVSASAPSLQSNTTSVQVVISQQSVVNLTLTPTGDMQTVTVSGNDAQLIDTQSATSTTTFTTTQFQDLPAPGGDISTIAYSVPGVVMATSTGGGLDSFSSNGIPGNANLIIINGADNLNSYYNVSNSGASSLSLGQQEIAQASVIQNGYSTQYGRQAGAIETYLTKGGTNRVHGLLTWTYNSDGLNANSFFNNLNGTPRGKAVSNQYAAQIGGPILHNKLFFFTDTEGIRYVEPFSSYVNFPSAALQNTILNTVSPASTGLYTQMFNLLKTAPTYNTATPVTTGSGPLQDSSGALGCGSYAGTPVTGQPNTYFGTAPLGGTSIPCINSSFTQGSDVVTEWFATGRIDWNVSDKQKIFVRGTDDYGFLPCCVISVVNPLLTGQLPQPLVSGQLNHVYIFNPSVSNQFIVAALYQKAFQKLANLQKTMALSPTQFIEGVDGGTNASPGLGQGGNIGYSWNGTPFGEATHQYQLIDDLSWLKGKHNLKFGFNLKRYYIVDEQNESGTTAGFFTFNSLRDFASGSLPGSSNSSFAQNFSSVPIVRTAEYNYGIYGQDEWKAASTLMIDYGIRIEGNGNPLCYGNCFSQYVGGFPDPTATLDTPYNATISTGHANAFPSIESAIIEPRAGFAWDMSGKGNSVVRAGVGLFADEFGAVLIAPKYTSFPNVFAPSVFAGLVSQGLGGSPGIAQESYNAIRTGFSNGQSANQLAASLPAGVPFSPPNYSTNPTKYVSPKYAEWSLQLQQQVTPRDAVIVSYAGNHGYDLTITNSAANQNLGGDAYLPASLYTSFTSIPVAPPDPRFKQVGTFSDGANSSYNGVSVQYKHIDRHGLTANVAYTYSHALDDISVGSSGPSLSFSNNAITSQITPNSTSFLMYSNSDFDIRHNLVLDVIYVEPHHFQHNLTELAAGGWTVAGKAFARSGLPFSVLNDNAQNALYNGSAPSTVLAEVFTNQVNHSCNSFLKPCFQVPNTFNGTGLTVNSAGNVVPDTPANAPNQSPQTGFGNVPRNAFYAPHYTDIDMSIYKDLIREKIVQFRVGAQAYNVLNHPNFGPPQNNASLSQNLGIINTTVAAPASPYGFFSGSAVSGRVLVVTGRLSF